MIETKYGPYDGALQMFVEPERELDEGVLRMWRARVERGELDDDIGPNPES